MLRLREFMFENVYLGPDAQREKPRIERMLRALFDHFADNPPPALTADATEEQRVIDWLAGMTDRFAVRDVRRPLAAAGVLSRGPLHQGLDRAGARRRRHGRARGREDRPAARRQPLAGPLPLPRRAHAVVLRQRRARSSTTASAARRAATRSASCRRSRGSTSREAVETLAERYNVELEREDEDPEAEKRRRAASACSPCSTARPRFYAAYLWELGRGGEGAGLPGRARASPTRCCGEFRVGYSPSAWDRVLVGAQRDGYTAQELLDVGAGAAQPERQPLRPLPRPDHVPAGRCARPGARLRGQSDAEGRGPKYLNSSESEHLPQGPPAVRHRRGARRTPRRPVGSWWSRVTPTCWRMHQAGIRETVAIMGTALTEDQVVELAKVARSA